MNLNTEPIKNWFGFTRRERRSTFSLLMIIVIILIIRYSIPNSNTTVESISPKVFESDNDAVSLQNDTTKPDETRGKIEKTFGSAQKYSARRTVFQSDSRKSIRPVDINLSDTSELVKLPGIGSVLSARIIKYRIYLGGYARVEQLKEVYGLSEETYEMIKNRVTADSAFIKRININTADYKELSHIRYLEKYEISSIMKYRQLKGKISKMSDLVDNKLITSEKAKKVGSYVRFE
jgi:competence ComEA-like helix-hairpin-helix protein